MARPGLDKWDVKRASEELAAQGRYPSADAVRAALGNTGSKSTIHKYLKELEQEAGPALARHADTASSIQALVQRLSATLHADADLANAQLRAGHAALMQQSEAEIAALRREVAALTFELSQAQKMISNLEALQVLPGIAPKVSGPSARPGFGVFRALVSNDRGGKGGLSHFTSLFDSRDGTADSGGPSQVEQGAFWMV